MSFSSYIAYRSSDIFTVLLKSENNIPSGTPYNLTDNAIVLQKGTYLVTVYFEVSTNDLLSDIEVKLTQITGSTPSTFIIDRLHFGGGSGVLTQISTASTTVFATDNTFNSIQPILQATCSTTGTTFSVNAPPTLFDIAIIKIA